MPISPREISGLFDSCDNLSVPVCNAIYSDSTTQTISSTGIALPITFNTVENENGLLLGQTSAVTISNASPCVVTWTGHGLYAGSSVVFTTDGELPEGITSGTRYYILATDLSENTFKVSSEPGGAAINTSTDGSGAHTGTNSSVIAIDSNCDAGGVFGFIFSTLCDCTSGNGTIIDIWFRKNGVNIARSNTRVQLATANNVVINVADIVTELAIGDKVEMMWTGSSVNNRLLAVAAQVSPDRPATPSTILTIKRISST